MAEERFGAKVAVYVLLRRQGKLLLLRRAGTNYFNGYLSLPSEHLEQGESLKTAAVREAKEEVGVDIKTQDLKLAHVINTPDKVVTTDTYVDFFFEVSNWREEPTICEPDKCSELIWIHPTKPPKDTVPEVMQALENIERGEIESEYGW